MKQVKDTFEEFLEAGIEVYRVIEKLEGEARRDELEVFERLKGELELFVFSLKVYERRNDV